MITSLKPDEIFVFGSNTLGIHGRGAAKQAAKDFGAKRGVGEGLTGQCYALPTLNGSYRFGELQLGKRSHEELVESFRTFFQYAADNPKLTFLLTKVGCGLAGYEEEYIKSGLLEAAMGFFGSVANVRFPEGW